MPRYVAFLRAVNVGGTGKLPMEELRAICTALGYQNVRTYIASGNVVFDTSQSQIDVRIELAEKLLHHFGKNVPVFIRTHEELSKVFTENPFPDVEENKHMVIFLDEALEAAAVLNPKYHGDELIAVRENILHVYYPNGMGKSKLKISGAEQGTARNMNTVRKIWEMLDG